MTSRVTINVTISAELDGRQPEQREIYLALAKKLEGCLLSEDAGVSDAWAIIPSGFTAQIETHEHPNRH